MDDYRNAETIFLSQFGGEPLANSGFEDEEPDPEFETEASDDGEGRR